MYHVECVVSSGLTVSTTVTTTVTTTVAAAAAQVKHVNFNQLI